MLINADYKLESDSLQFILYKKVSGKKGDTWKTVGYYATIAGALESLVMKEVYGTGVKDLQTVQAKIDELKITINRLVIST